jgi:hypothetical protein
MTPGVAKSRLDFLRERGEWASSLLVLGQPVSASFGGEEIRGRVWSLTVSLDPSKNEVTIRDSQFRLVTVPTSAVIPHQLEEDDQRQKGIDDLLSGTLTTIPSPGGLIVVSIPEGVVVPPATNWSTARLYQEVVQSILRVFQHYYPLSRLSLKDEAEGSR